MRRLLFRSLRHYWRTNVAVVAGVAAAVAVLAGALLVGQSVQASLRDLLTERIGATDYVVSADHFFRESLADELRRPQEDANLHRACPIIAVKGVARREGSRRDVFDVNVYGVDERFWRLHGLSVPAGFDGRASILGAPLAAQLGAKTGDTLLLRLASGRDVPGETLYGRRDENARTMRLTGGGIASTHALGEFALRPSQGLISSIFVPLARLQRELAQPGKANAILVASASHDDESKRLAARLRERLTPADVGVRLRSVADGTASSLESERVLIGDALVRTALDAAQTTQTPASAVFSYLANSIRTRGREVPYSVIAAADLEQGTLRDVRYVAGTPMSATPGAERSIWLNEWARADLGAAVGDPIEVDYYAWDESKGLVTKTASFTLAGVVALGGAVDTTLAPEVQGVTDADNLRDWDPPFPVDLGRIRPQDEDYWEQHRGTPKAFVTLSTGQALWRGRFGQLTSVRAALPPDAFANALARRIDPGAAGFTIAAVRGAGLDASRGAVDLGAYFLYFSAFLIAAAVMLAASFFRLGIEQRVREIGALRSLGFPIATIRRVFLTEGAILLAIGGLLGLLGALAYGGALIAGLRTWWLGAVGTERLSLHVFWPALAIGMVGGTSTSLGVIAWTLRGVAGNSPRALLAGSLEPPMLQSGQAHWRRAVPLVTGAAAMIVLAATKAGLVPEVAGFFTAGGLLLTSTLSLAARFLRRARPRPISGHGWRAIARFSVRGAAHRPARSLLPIALIASATFVIVSVEAFRKDAGVDAHDRRSGTGGYASIATSPVPLLSNPATPEGLESLGLEAVGGAEITGARFVAFRERAGDDASCLNLYAPGEPRILGAPAAFVAAGRFSFASSLAASPEEHVNPWLLLERPTKDDVVPAIADANSLEYSLHLAVGEETTVRGGDGVPVRLRIVAALADSMLQGALIVSEANFLRVFPAHEGYGTLLVDIPDSAAAAALTDRLADAGLRIESTAERLASYRRVENTYLSTFQSLGTLGLVLGTVGLLAVLLRNLLERRSELALLRAIGFRERTLAVMVVLEHVSLLAVGLACGTVSAMVAIAPALANRGGGVPAATIAMLLVSVSGAGLVASLVGGAAVLRTPLVEALRSE